MTAVPTTRTLGKDSWMTPPEVFGPVHEVFNFDFDAAAGSPREARLPVFIDPTTDALTCTWHHFGRKAWLNPPYGRGLSDWFAKVKQEMQAGMHFVCMLTYANTETRYWQEYVAENPFCHRVVFIHGRIKFINPDDPEGGATAPKGSALVLYYGFKRVGPIAHHYWDPAGGSDTFPFNTRSNA